MTAGQLLTRCCLCGRPGVPLADYERPVCIDCDARMDAIVERALLEPVGEVASR